MKKAIFLAVVIFLTMALGSHLWGQTITVTSPAANNEWCRGSSHTITWTSSGVTGNVAIHLYPVNQPNVSPMLIASNTANDGNFLWLFPASCPTGTYTIRVQSGVPGAWIFDYSDYFTIKACPSQTVVQSGTQGTVSNPGPAVLGVVTKPTAKVPNLQLTSYATITSFKVNGQSTSSHTNRIVCHREPHIVLYANAVSSVTPISYRFKIDITNPYDAYVRNIYDSNWISQNQKNFTISYAQALDKICPNGIPAGETIRMMYYGEITVYAKNDSQSEQPQSKIHAIKFWID
ncbi:MAG: hypothetical protein IH584_05650 [Candidatus Aminicenantes bacterium]|nr:hypothetical protein [Candidatus Aminicenantes bacterium]